MSHLKSTAADATPEALAEGDQELMRTMVREVMQQILEAEMTDAPGG